MILMPCVVCASSNQICFPSEMNIQFPFLKNAVRPSVLIFPKVLVCLECGFASFTVPEAELRELRDVNA